MADYGIPGKYDLKNHGLRNLGDVYWNLSPASLVEQVILRGEGTLAPGGAVVVNTGKFTGRSPKDKFIVKYGAEFKQDIWWGKTNQEIDPDQFTRLLKNIDSYFQKRDIFVQDLHAGRHPDYSLPIRVITEKAWSALFAHDLFIRIPPEKISSHIPEFTIIHAPDFHADREEDGTNSETFIVLDFTRQMVLIGGTSYAGEIKKSIFTVMNYLLPLQGVLSMHCSANVGPRGDVALFFGLSGTGKTTLSSDPERKLIGDDEHGWGPSGVFNIEGGCYAKTIRLRPDLEPLIWSATHQFGTVLENVVCDPLTRHIDFDSDVLTENTRAAYPIEYIHNRVLQGYSGHPENIFFLTADAFGVIPPISRLTSDQAMYYFLSGYTSKLAGTEKGLGIEPQATFSTCFAAPFIPLQPGVYASLLGKKIEEHRANVWLINTGWTGGPYGIGKRIPLPHTRAMVRAALMYHLEEIPMRRDRFFGLWVPKACPDIPQELLNPEQTWDDHAAYERQAQEQSLRFIQNFEQFASHVTPQILAAGPGVPA